MTDRIEAAGLLVAPELKAFVADEALPGTGIDEAAFWRDALPPDAVPSEVDGRAVLLVVDATSSLWPITVAAAALRRAGATAVLPLLLHRRP